MVKHCGHQTALWPYYAILPDGTEPMVWFPAGFRGKRSKPAYRATPKWAYLHECQDWILRVHHGESAELLLVSAEELEEIERAEDLKRAQLGLIEPSCGLERIK